MSCGVSIYLKQYFSNAIIILQEKLGKKMSKMNWADFLKTESIRRVNKFYETVLDSFMTSFYKQNKYKNNAIDEDVLIEFEKKIQRKLKDPQMLFQAANKYREGREEEDLNALERKQLSEMSKEQLKKTFEQCKIEESIKEMLDEEDQEDDLGSPHVFESTKTYVNAVKEEEDYSKYEPKYDNFLSESSSEDYPSENDSDSLENFDSFSCRITGMYKFNTLKYKSKEQKYEIGLTNTFLKIPEGELFCDMFLIETTKIDKDLVQAQINNHR